MNPVEMIGKASWIDLVALVLMIWGILVGLKRGMEVEFSKLVGIAASTLLTLHFYEPLASRFHLRLAIWDSVSKLVTFAVMAFIITIFVKFVFLVLSKVVTLKFSPLLSHVGGAVVAVLRLFLVFSLLTYFLMLTPFGFLRQSLGYDRSVTGPFFLASSDAIHTAGAKYLPTLTKKSVEKATFE